MKIFKDHAVLDDGKIISLYEAACILARAMHPMCKALYKEDGYEHYELAMALEYNVIYAEIDGEEDDV